MSPLAVILTILGYFAVVLLLSRLATRRGVDFFALRSHRWWVVTLGMVSACMSGVSFVSVPGMVAGSGMGYLQMCIGFFLGYLVIAFVLAPLYFRMGSVSIYGWLEKRFGLTAHRTGAWLFFGSQLLRASMRLFLLCITQQLMIFDPLGLPFALNAVVTVGVLLAYTWKGGVRSVVAADILRTVCMVSAIALTVYFIARALPGSLPDTLRESGMTRVFFFDDVNSPNYFWKQLLGGFFIVIAMTGMDQEMMQRTLTCRSLRDAQKQLVLSSALQIVVIAGFLVLGVLLRRALCPRPLRRFLWGRRLSPDRPHNGLYGGYPGASGQPPGHPSGDGRGNGRSRAAVSQRLGPERAGCDLYGGGIYIRPAARSVRFRDLYPAPTAGILAAAGSAARCSGALLAAEPLFRGPFRRLSLRL